MIIKAMYLPRSPCQVDLWEPNRWSDVMVYKANSAYNSMKIQNLFKN